MAEKTTRVRFRKNTCYRGTDYGPAYAKDVEDVESKQALVWIIGGRCDPAVAPDSKKKATTKKKPSSGKASRTHGDP